MLSLTPQDVSDGDMNVTVERLHPVAELTHHQVKHITKNSTNH